MKATIDVNDCQCQDPDPAVIEALICGQIDKSLTSLIYIIEDFSPGICIHEKLGSILGGILIKIYENFEEFEEAVLMIDEVRASSLKHYLEHKKETPHA